MDRVEHAVHCIDCGHMFQVTQAIAEACDATNGHWRCDGCWMRMRRAYGSRGPADAEVWVMPVEPLPVHLRDGTGEWKPITAKASGGSGKVVMDPKDVRDVLNDALKRLADSRGEVTAAELNTTQEVANAEYQRLRAELAEEKARYERFERQRDENLRAWERLHNALDEATRFLAGLNLQDHSVKEQHERARIVRAAMVALNPKGVSVDNAAEAHRRADDARARVARLAGPSTNRHSTLPPLPKCPHRTVARDMTGSRCLDCGERRS
jgi:hypothetical protein